MERARTEARLVRLERKIARGGGMLDRFGEVPEHERGERDHFVRVDQLVTVLERLRDRDPPLVLRVRLAEVSELAVGVADRVEAQRDLPQEPELLRDRQRLLRGRERA